MLVSKSYGFHSSNRGSYVKCCCIHGDSIFKKIDTFPKSHYDYKRTVFDSFIYQPNEHLTQTELRSLVKDHQLRIECRKNRLYLQISPQKWGDKEYEVWDYITGVFNDWNLMSLIREELSVFPENLDAPMIIPLQMEFVRVDEKETRYDDWIDHA